MEMKLPIAIRSNKLKTDAIIIIFNEISFPEDSYDDRKYYCIPQNILFASIYV